jgi:peptide-methionine (S)-S-oxide reductase
VIRTRVGYAGGTTSNPTYYNIGNHSETVQIDYDPTLISYEELLAVFWKTHNPVYKLYSEQYKSIIFYTNEEQKNLAIESKQREEAKRGEKVYTEILPFSSFTLAEDYHQKYYLRQYPDIFETFSRIYPDLNSLINSTAVTRINGYLGGYGTLEDLEKQLHSFGLSSSGEKQLLEISEVKLPNNNNSAVCPIPN